MVSESLWCLVEVEVVAAVDVDVFSHGWSEVGDVVVVDLEAGGAVTRSDHSLAVFGSTLRSTAPKATPGAGH